MRLLKIGIMMRDYLAITCILAGFLSCAEESSNTGQVNLDAEHLPPLFTLLSPHETGVDFMNDVKEDFANNIFFYEYMYNGGGVAIGDVNNDDLPDIFFTGNRTSNRLYINKGNFQFEDVTESAGLTRIREWSNGATMVDINQDGYLDIYVCNSYMLTNPPHRSNFLFINNGDGTFSEQAHEFGLNDRGFSVHSGFFDYDKDGDLDMYLTSHMNDAGEASDFVNRHKKGNQFTTDRLFRNDGNNKFSDVTEIAGLHNYGCGLGLAIGDVNNDSWPDIYIANDYEEPDFYYVNNGDGTFSEQLQQHFKHSEFFGMGTALNDFNNDGLLDLMALDMVAEDNFRQKTMMAPMNANKYWQIVNIGYHHQFMRNVFQINNGNGSFSDLAYLSGISNTDWSWAPVAADFNNDGWQDVYVTNGFRRDGRNKDANKKIEDFIKVNEGRMKKEYADSMLNMYPSQKIVNYFYRNNGDYTFSNVSEREGIVTPSFSNGAAYADLDLDGDLDLVVNNILDSAFIYRNNSVEQNRGNYLRIKLAGPKGNLSGLGAKVKLLSGGKMQFQESSVTRGYLSCMEAILHFGLGAAIVVDKLEVQWPDGSWQELTNIVVNQVLELEHKNAGKKAENESPLPPIFAEFTNESGVDFRHKENTFDDYAKEILLPHKMSQFGPALTTGDVNGDGLDDFYIGGAVNQAGQLYLQQNGEKFERANDKVWQADSKYEDVAALLFDSDGDKDLDLYVVSGGNEFQEGNSLLQDRLYINDGKGNFVRGNNLLPIIGASGGCVAAADYDSDGDLDLFIGGRVKPGNYPFPGRSFLLKNDKGRFTDVTASIAPDLMEPGLVTSASWVDLDADNALDLMLVGEWMPITYFKNEGGKLSNRTASTGLENTEGWWNRIVSADLDGDGDLDFVVGNLGLNYKYKASIAEPFQVYCHDFDGSGTLDIALGYFNDGKCFPVRGRQCSSEQVPRIKEIFPTYAAFGQATMLDVYGEGLEQALHYNANEFASVWLENKGSGKLELRPLPTLAQVAPIHGVIIKDFNKDGKSDILLAGNFYVSEIETGRADAGIGLLLSNMGNGNFVPVGLQQSGFFADKDVRNIALLNNAKTGQPTVVVANNDDTPQLFQTTDNRQNPVQ